MSMKSIKFFITLLFTAILIGCGSTSSDHSDHSDVIAMCDYYYQEGMKYSTLVHIYGELSPSEQTEFDRLESQEREYRNSLTSEELDVYRARIQELNNMY